MISVSWDRAKDCCLAYRGGEELVSGILCWKEEHGSWGMLSDRDLWWKGKYSYIFIYICLVGSYMHRAFSQRKTAHTPHHFVAHTQKFHCACFLPEQVTVSRELPVHRLCSRTQIGSTRISDHCNLVNLYLSPVIRNINQYNRNTNVVLSNTLTF